MRARSKPARFLHSASERNFHTHGLESDAEDFDGYA